MVTSFFSLVLSCSSVLEIFGGGILNSVVELMQSSRIEIYTGTFKFKTGNFKIIEVGVSEK